MSKASLKPARNTVIAALVSALLGALGGFLGKDLSPFAQPATEAVIQGADALEKGRAK
jgi:hypothetical protein